MSSAGVVLAAGGIAGLLSWLLALPADVVKTVIQGAPVGTPVKDLRMRVVVAQLWKEGGVAAFYRGLVPCLARSLPVNACCFLVRLGLRKVVGGEACPSTRTYPTPTPHPFQAFEWAREALEPLTERLS